MLTTDIPSDSHFCDRFAIFELPGAGLLLDLYTGAYYETVGPAVEIYRGLVAGRPPTEVALELATLYGLTSARAERDVATSLDAVSRPVTQSVTYPNRFDQLNGGYQLTYRGHPALWTDAAGTRLRRIVDPLPDAEAILHWAVPHLMALRGHLVLHGSAVAWRGGLSAFCGRSKLGKTTLARSLAVYEPTLVSEDLIAVAPDRPFRVFVGAEPATHVWARNQAAELSSRDEIPLNNLDDIPTGEALPLVEILFPERWEQATLNRVSLPPIKGLIRMVANSFAEIGDRRVWRELMAAHRDLAANIPVGRVMVPEGLDRLMVAAGQFYS